MSDQRFRPRERLRRRNDFARVYGARCSRGDSYFVVYIAGNELSWSRLGIVTGRRLGNAVFRNRNRRRVREAIRRMKDEFPKGYDFVCVVRRVYDRTFEELQSGLKKLMIKAAAAWEAKEVGSKPRLGSENSS